VLTQRYRETEQRRKKRGSKPPGAWRVNNTITCQSAEEVRREETARYVCNTGSPDGEMERMESESEGWGKKGKRVWIESWAMSGSLMGGGGDKPEKLRKGTTLSQRGCRNQPGNISGSHENGKIGSSAYFLGGFFKPVKSQTSIPIQFRGFTGQEKKTAETVME